MKGGLTLEDYPLCACGCGERVTRKGANFIDKHGPKKKCINLTSDILKDPLIYQKAIEHMQNFMIDGGYWSRNKNIKTNCKVIKPLRGTIRLFKDNYVQASFKSPYNEVDFYIARSHRLAAMLYIGEIPDNYFAIHKCDIKMCCNPDHLYIGTIQDNQLDFSNRRGNYSPNARLTRYCCESIKYYKNLGEHTIPEIAKAHNCSEGTVVTIENRNFSTDGSEVIGDIFVPVIIPDSRRVTRMKRYVKLGKEICEIYDSLRKKFPPWSRPGIKKPFYQMVNNIYGLNEHAVDMNMKLYLANIHRANYKYSRYIIYKMIREGTNISVPV